MLEFEKRYDGIAIEPQMQKYWEDNHVYDFVLDESREVYSIDTPPPTVNGSLHIGHIFSYTQAEMIARYRRMKGYNVFYPFGFDDNGLPSERLVEKETNIKACDVPRSEFCNKCVEITQKYEKEFRTSEFNNIEADIVYKIKNKNAFILIEHQSSVDIKMPYRILRYKCAIIESAIDKKRFKEQGYKIPTVIPIVLYTGKRKWKKLSINDIEETIEGYQENWLEYTLIDANKFSKEKLLEDNLIISKAMLIEKSKNKEELYKNIEDIINIQKEKNTFDNLQLEKLIKYELSETEDKNIMNEFIEKIRNVEGRDKIMTNASRIINREIRKQRKAGLEQGFKQGTIQIAKKLKREMSIKDISRITGLTEQEIENL